MHVQILRKSAIQTHGMNIYAADVRRNWKTLLPESIAMQNQDVTIVVQGTGQ
jgi:hypothetical protein